MLGDSQVNKGKYFHQLNKLSEASKHYKLAININPKNFEALFFLSIINIKEQKFDIAVNLLKKAIVINPNFPEAHSNLGIALSSLNLLEDAIIVFKKAISLNLNFYQAYCNLGNVLQKLKKFQEAIDNYDKAIDLNRNYAKAYSNRGLALEKLKQSEIALSSLNKAIDINPNYAEAHLNRGIVLKSLNRLEESLVSFDKAIFLVPSYAEAYCNRGNVLAKLKNLEASINSFEKAISLNANYFQAYYNKGIVSLLNEDFENGWSLYESRLQFKNINNKSFKTLPKRWNGKDNLINKKILIYCEQGLGDSIQFSRYCKLLRSLGAYVCLESPKKLLPLFRYLEGVDEITEHGSVLYDHFDYSCPLLSLPLAFNTIFSTIPSAEPYIKLDSMQERIDKWKKYIGPDGFKIAICYQGNKQHEEDASRSFSIKFFEKISKIKGIRLISLQKNFETHQKKSKIQKEIKIEMLPNCFDKKDNEFLDSAAVMKCVDLTITSDTSLTHLAGALGMKTWLALQYVPDWRWFLNRSSTPWYKNHKLFRQKNRGDWLSVFETMETEIKKIIKNNNPHY